MARLKYGKGRERRLREHMEAFDAHRRKMKTLGALTVANEIQHSGPRGARSSKASSTLEHSRTSSIYADSGIQVDDEGPSAKQASDENGEFSQDNTAVADSNAHAINPSETGASSAPSFEGYGLRQGLDTVQEDGETPEPTALLTDTSLAPEEISPEDTQNVAPDRKLSKIPAGPGPKTVDQIEEKEGLPAGFIGWFRKISLGSHSESRHASTASYASRTSLRFSHSVRNSVATSISMGYHQERVPKDAICKYLGSNSAVVEPSAGYVEELIQRGANVNAKNARGETPLHFAVGRGAIVICTILLQHGADADAKSSSGETIWDFGRRVSKNTLNPEASYDKREQLLRTMVAARIEFLRATIKFNPDMIVEEPERAKRRRNSDRDAAVNAWSRSGAGSGGGRKKSKVVTPKMERSPSVAMSNTSKAESSRASPAESTQVSHETTPQPPNPSQWQYSTQTGQPIPDYTTQTNEVSYFPTQQDFSMYDNHTNFTQPFSTDVADPIYTDLPTGFFEGQEFDVDPQAFDLAASSFQEDTATLHASQNMGYLDNSMQNYTQASPGHISNVQNYAQASSGDHNNVQQSFVQASPDTINNVQQYAQPTPENLHNVQQYTQPSPSNIPQYTQPSPPSYPEGTVSPAHLSIGASPPSQLSPPGQYFSDYPPHIERENSSASHISNTSNISSVDPVVVPTYNLGINQTMQSANACLPPDPQRYTGFDLGPGPAATTSDHLWEAYQRDQRQNWAANAGYSH